MHGGGSKQVPSRVQFCSITVVSVSSSIPSLFLRSACGNSSAPFVSIDTYFAFYVGFL